MQQVSKRPNKVIAFLTSRKAVPYVFVAPFIIYFLLIYLYPTVSTILMSFQRIDGPTISTWIGFSNYQKLFSRNFIQSLETTTRYAFWDVVILTSVPLIFAVILHSGLVKGAAFFKSLFFIPALTSIIQTPRASLLWGRRRSSAWRQTASDSPCLSGRVYWKGLH